MFVRLVGEQRLHLLHRRRVLVLQVAELGDTGFPFGDERIELGNLDGVLALLVFAEAEEIGPVLRTPAVKEEFVLFADGGAEQIERFLVIVVAPDT